jgi:hypothetical protein
MGHVMWHTINYLEKVLKSSILVDEYRLCTFLIAV